MAASASAADWKRLGGIGGHGASGDRSKLACSSSW